MAADFHFASCPSTFGTGGLGQHLARIGSDIESDGGVPRFYCHSREHEDSSFYVSGQWERKLFRWPPFRWNPSLRVWFRHEWFDRMVARRLVPGASFTVFMGAGLHSLRRARQLGIPKLVLEMPNSHPRNVRERHALAFAAHPIEPTWMGEMLCRKIERELRLVDEVRVNSGYTWETAQARGVPAAILRRRHLPAASRFNGVRRSPPEDGTRRAVFVGSLGVSKGVPLIVDAFRGIEGADLRLVLVGGWSSPGMRSFLEAAMAADSRISVRPGDPVPHLASAEIAVHPAWEDGWGYAPAEAIAAGVPTWVSDHTGAKELLVEGIPGGVLPAGSPEAWAGLLRRWEGKNL